MSDTPSPQFVVVDHQGRVGPRTHESMISAKRDAEQLVREIGGTVSVYGELARVVCDQVVVINFTEKEDAS